MDRDCAKKIVSDPSAKKAFVERVLHHGAGVAHKTLMRAVQRFTNWALDTGKQGRSGANNPAIQGGYSDMGGDRWNASPAPGSYRGHFSDWESANRHADNLREAGVPQTDVTPTENCWMVTASS